MEDEYRTPRAEVLYTCYNTLLNISQVLLDRLLADNTHGEVKLNLELQYQAVASGRNVVHKEYMKEQYDVH